MEDFLTVERWVQFTLESCQLFHRITEWLGLVQTPGCDPVLSSSSSRTTYSRLSRSISSQLEMMMETSTPQGNLRQCSVRRSCQRDCSSTCEIQSKSIWGSTNIMRCCPDTHLGEDPKVREWVESSCMREEAVWARRLTILGNSGLERALRDVQGSLLFQEAPMRRSDQGSQTKDPQASLSSTSDSTQNHPKFKPHI